MSTITETDKVQVFHDQAQLDGACQPALDYLWANRNQKLGNFVDNDWSDFDSAGLTPTERTRWSFWTVLLYTDVTLPETILDTLIDTCLDNPYYELASIQRYQLYEAKRLLHPNKEVKMRDSFRGELPLIERDLPA